MADTEKAEPFFSSFGAWDISHFSDPEKKLYDAFGLKTGSFLQVLGPQSFFRGVQAFRHGIGVPVGDVWQMPGTFLIHKGNIVRSFINETVSDIPDYEGMVCGRD